MRPAVCLNLESAYQLHLVHSHTQTSELCYGFFHDKFETHGQIRNIKPAQSRTLSITHKTKKPEQVKTHNPYETKQTRLFAE